MESSKKTLIATNDDEVLHLTLEDNVITYYTSVDSSGAPQGLKGRIHLQHLRAVVVRGHCMIIETPDNTWELHVNSEDEAQLWAGLVEEASEEWARHETKSSISKAALAARNSIRKQSPKKLSINEESTLSNSGILFEGNLEVVTPGLFSPSSKSYASQLVTSSLFLLCLLFFTLLYICNPGYIYFAKNVTPLATFYLFIV
eukprot:m.96126 g.96126  ORF g.96126 m.96126 type:complete len:201 (+) comp8962_c0_seq1:59-661(+)